MDFAVSCISVKVRIVALPSKTSVIRFFNCPSPTRHGTHFPQPVSYTHLDVYKRQPHSLIDMLEIPDAFKPLISDYKFNLIELRKSEYLRCV